MDILKRNIAPLAASAWTEIDARASEVLRSRLTARKAVKVEGPKGWDFNALSEGRLDRISQGESGVKTGVYRIKPLVEARVTFKLNRWELDNITRGAKGIDLGNLDEAVKQIGDFEERAIYYGYESGGIQGLEQSSGLSPLAFGNDGSSIMDSLAQGLLLLKEHFHQGGSVLIVGEEAFTRLNREAHGYPLVRRIETLIGGKILLSPVVTGAFLLPFDNENLELTIGHDFAIGYESHDSEEVKFFISESFTFRVLDENLIVKYNL